MIITRLGNHHGMVLVVRYDSKMVAFDIEELLTDSRYHYLNPLGLERSVEKAAKGVPEEDWQTPYELFHFLEHGH